MKVGPTEDLWQDRISSRLSSAVMWSTDTMSLTPHRKSTIWQKHTQMRYLRLGQKHRFVYLNLYVRGKEQANIQGSIASLHVCYIRTIDTRGNKTLRHLKGQAQGLAEALNLRIGSLPQNAPLWHHICKAGKHNKQTTTTTKNKM